jgi:hypothetical protein
MPVNAADIRTRSRFAACEPERRRSPRTLLPLSALGRRDAASPRRQSAAVGLRSPQFGDRRRSRPRGRRDYRNGGKTLVRSRGLVAVPAGRLRQRPRVCWYADSEQARSHLAGTGRIEGRCDLDHRAVAWQAERSSHRCRHARCSNSSNSGAITATRLAAAHRGRTRQTVLFIPALRDARRLARSSLPSEGRSR